MTSFSQNHEPTKASNTNPSAQKMPSPLQEIITSSPYHSNNVPITPPSSNPSNKSSTPEDEKENAVRLSPTSAPTVSSTSSSITNPTTTFLPLVPPSAADLDAAAARRVQAAYKAIGPIRMTHLGVEHDYKVDRKRDLRVEKIWAARSTDMPKALRDRLAEVSRARVEREKKERMEREKCEAREEVLQDGTLEAALVEGGQVGKEGGDEGKEDWEEDLFGDLVEGEGDGDPNGEKSAGELT